MRIVTTAIALTLAGAVGLGVLQAQDRRTTPPTSPAASPPTAPPIKLTTPYQVVGLSGGQVFIGRLEGAGSAYPVLVDVYYIVTRSQGDGRPPVNNLVKRANEWHAPDRMILNAAHVMLIEPVTAGSALDKLIQDDKAQKAPLTPADIPKSDPTPAKTAPQ